MLSHSRSQLIALLFCILRNCLAQDTCTDVLERYAGYRVKAQRANALVNSVELAPPPGSDPLTLCSFECERSSACGGFDVTLKTSSGKSECRLFDRSMPADIVQFVENWLEKDDSVAVSLIRKVCIPGVQKCASSAWYFEAVPGWTMIGPGITNKYIHVRTMQECQQKCVQETDFVCRSAVFNTLIRECALSKYDRRSIPDRLRRQLGSLFDFRPDHQFLIYLEQQCLQVPKGGCTFTPTDGLAMDFTWAVQQVANEQDCRSICENDEALAFVCRSYQYDAPNQLCNLGSEDRYSMLTMAGLQGTKTSYFEKGECMTVLMDCDLNNMNVRYRMNHEFNGKIYAMGAKQNCSFDIREKFNFDVQLPLKDKQRCNLVEELPNVLSTTAMMQYHDMVLTGMDRMFKFMCTYDVGAQEVAKAVEFRLPTPPPGVVTAASTSLPSSTPSTTSPVVLLVTSGSVPPRRLPRAVMKIVNGDGRKVTTAEVGETLYAEVYLEGDDADDYGIAVTNCVATIGNMPDVTLVDQTGCPIDTSVFEGFSPVDGSNNQKLKAAFRGFRFEKRSRVNLNCDVNLCYKFCEPALCTDRNGRNIQSYGRRRRRRWVKENYPTAVQRKLYHHEAGLFRHNATVLQLPNEYDRPIGGFAEMQNIQRELIVMQQPQEYVAAGRTVLESEIFDPESDALAPFAVVGCIVCTILAVVCVVFVIYKIVDLQGSKWRFS